MCSCNCLPREAAVPTVESRTSDANIVYCFRVIFSIYGTPRDMISDVSTLSHTFGSCRRYHVKMYSVIVEQQVQLKQIKIFLDPPK